MSKPYAICRYKTNINNPSVSLYVWYKVNGRNKRFKTKESAQKFLNKLPPEENWKIRCES